MNKEKHPEIPEGPYCYFGSRAPGDKKYKPCPHWEWLGHGRARCNLLKVEDDVEDDKGRTPLCLWDQVKECYYNYER